MFSGANILSICARDAVPGVVRAESPLAAASSALIAWSRNAVVFATASTLRNSGDFGRAASGASSFLTVGASSSRVTVGSPGLKPSPGLLLRVAPSCTHRLTLPSILGSFGSPVLATVVTSGEWKPGAPGTIVRTHVRGRVKVVISTSNSTSLENTCESGLPDCAFVAETAGPAEVLSVHEWL
ncbi:hypothetical protein Lesp01_08240 [Lentzea sp. NBRC 102530]|nr:hypothetical protein Lesp01_08240 [Lentzea sp. NBRC 102530]